MTLVLLKTGIFQRDGNFFVRMEAGPFETEVQAVASGASMHCAIDRAVQEATAVPQSKLEVN